MTTTAAAASTTTTTITTAATTATTAATAAGHLLSRRLLPLPEKSVEHFCSPHLNKDLRVRKCEACRVRGSWW